MKYINQFTSIEDYIKYKKNNKENLPGVNRAIEDNILTTNVDYPNSFVFIDDENNTNYNIIRFKSYTKNTRTANYLNTVYDKWIFDDNTGCYMTTIITKNYLYKPLLEIPDDTFLDFNMVNIDLPNTIKKIGNCAFKNTNLESISLNENIFYVGNRAFEGCKNLKNIEFKNDKEDIILGENILNGCSSLHNITFYNIEAPILDNIGNNTKYVFYDDSTTNFYKTITLPVDYNTDTWLTLLSYDESFRINKIRHKINNDEVEYDYDFYPQYIPATADGEFEIDIEIYISNATDELTGKTGMSNIIPFTTTIEVTENYAQVARYSPEYEVEIEYNNNIDYIYIPQLCRGQVDAVIYDEDVHNFEALNNVNFVYENTRYKCFKSTNTSNPGSVSLLKLRLNILTEYKDYFSIYILNDADGAGGDFIGVSPLGTQIHPDDYIPSERLDIRPNHIDHTIFTNYKKYTYSSLSSDYYELYIVFKKVSETLVGTNSGYVLIPEDYIIEYEDYTGSTSGCAGNEYCDEFACDNCDGQCDQCDCDQCDQCDCDQCDWDW